MLFHSDSDMDRILNKLDIVISYSGYVKTDLTWGEDNITSPYSRLYFVIGGSGGLKYGGKTLKMRPGYLYFVPAGLNFCYYSTPRLEKLFFHINIIKPDGYDLTQSLKKCEEIPFDTEETEKMLKLYESDDFYDALLLKGKIYSAVITVLKKYSFEVDNRLTYSKKIQDAIEYINDNLSMKLTTDEIAKKLFVSPSTLIKNFKKEVGVSIGRYIDDRIFFRAECMLSQTDRPIAEISKSLGFCDQFYFSRRFSEKHGETPSVYRKRARNIY